MAEFEFADLLGAVARPDGQLTLGPHLLIPEAPKPFVAPTLRVNDDSRQPLAREVLFIQASAAVGKSTIARYLSSSCGLPFLDLAQVPVSTGTMKALLVGIRGTSDPLAAFHAGHLPIVIDALDEGRLLSGETGLESFLETTAALLGENRSVVNRPKLIFFGRYESTELATLSMEIADQDIRFALMELGFFGKDAAWELIKAHSDVLAEPTAPYRQHPGPVHSLIQSYFDAIDTALGLQGNLWLSDHGKAFAGYAPVLAALGALIAKMDNFQEVTNRLVSTGAREAWAVVEEVLNGIMDREQGKLRDKLSVQVTGPLSEDIYGASEQLRLLFQYAHGQALRAENPSQLRGSDLTKYRTMISLQIPEHPFVRQQEFRNPVLGSVVMAHAILNGSATESSADRLADLSRQPFLWRTLASKLGNESLIEGSDLGYILNSFWSDPLSPASSVVIREGDEQEVFRVYMPVGRADERAFSVVGPLTFFAQMRACDIDVAARVRILGYAPRGSTATFYFRGPSTVLCSSLDIVAESLRFNGEVWLEADDFTAPPRLALFPNGANLGWGGGLVGRYPWNDVETKLPPPYATPARTSLEVLIRECARRFPSGVAPTVHPNYSPADDDPYLRWVRRQFPESFPALMGLLIKHGLASAEAIPASGQGKVRIRFSMKWEELTKALTNPSAASSQIRNLLAEAQQLIG